MKINIELFKNKINELVKDISNKNYKNIELKNEYGHTNMNELENRIKEYNKTIIPLPEEAFEIAEIYIIEKENRIDIYIPLWTKEEGRSDLTLSIGCYLIKNEPVIKIDDLEVL
jgi:hypothetical protein